MLPFPFKLYSRSLPLNTVNANFFHSTQKKLLAKMSIKLPYGKFPCSFGRVAFVNNKFFITHLWPASKIILFSRHVNCNYFLFLSSYVRWLANTLLQRHICEVLLFTAILRNTQARNTRFTKPISVKLTHAQTFFRGVPKLSFIYYPINLFIFALFTLVLAVATIQCHIASFSLKGIRLKYGSW